MNSNPAISDIDFYRIKAQNGLIGFVNFLIDGTIAINGVSVYQKLDGSGFRLAYPIRKLNNGKQINLIHPVSWKVGSKIEQQVNQHLMNNLSCGGKDAVKKQKYKHKS